MDLQMDARKALVFFSEIQVQCGFALDALHEVQLAVAQYQLAGPDSPDAGPSCDAIFRNLLSFLSHAANVSKLLWPLTPRHQRDETDDAHSERTARADRRHRGMFLRKALGVLDTSPLSSRTLRDHLEHFDERLDQWWADPGDRTYLQDYVGDVRLRTSIPTSSQMRSYDPVRGVFGFRGEEFDLAPLRQEMEIVKQRSAAAAFDALREFRLASSRHSPRPLL